ncbi:NADH-quinone oxidoreductase subunit J [Tumebacillus sp. ITR2]|jgi:NADH-quinone oxidoreductase subunit J|uniref:NADH-quinone oxidoreductase subunit J n=1 Tax=Tumebacillus amylolyticus TaxID=2801339 RepID=A0ABS1J5B7_9BACL|nr:NADH-quinone oxidoreductase subunit J [Tumebacillus amylolyticus]MBL0385451.1 NADH-quinone oxidoreductase subunit J [Tumebacillus amylolyticus]
MFSGLVITGQTVAFFLIALFLIACGVMLLSMKKVIYMAISIGGVFIGAAAIYILLEADFLAFAQVLVYAGAITIMLLFAIMLTKHEEMERPAVLTAHPVWATIGTAGLGLIVLWVVKFSNIKWPQATPDSPFQGQDNVKLIGEALFSQYVIPFELVSVVLIVALVGAITLANKEEKK